MSPWIILSALCGVSLLITIGAAIYWLNLGRKSGAGEDITHD